MLSRIRKSMTEDEGFTLIELLVVIIIIGILAAIAIPVFLSQRQKGWDAAAKSDARNIGLAEETYFTDSNAYAPCVAGPTSASNTCTTAGVTGVTPSNNVTSTVTVKVDATGANAIFCVTSKHGSSSNTWVYDSSTGGLQAKGGKCSFT